MSRVKALVWVGVVAGAHACGPAQTGHPLAGTSRFDVPAIEEAPPVADIAVEMPVAKAPDVFAFDVRFGGAAELPSAIATSLTSMRMVMAPPSSDRHEERAVEITDDTVMLTGTAEAISHHQWLVGVSGATNDACIVMRMTAEREGDGLVGWAVVDSEGRASSLSFVAIPTAPDAG